MPPRLSKPSIQPRDIKRSAPLAANSASVTSLNFAKAGG
jgi:hypothetical protein